MHATLVLAAAKPCTGDWQQKWNCGWKQPTTTAANAGAFAGHNIAPVLIGLAIVLLVVIAASRSKSGSPATSKS